MKIAVEVAAPVANVLGECPLWDERAGLLWWVDSRAPSVQRLDPVTGAVSVLPLPETVGSIAFRERGGMLAATKSGIHFLDPDTGGLTQAARPEAQLPDNRFNDERVFADTGAGRPDGSCVDADGCLWNADYGGSRLLRYSPAGSVDRVIELPVSNPTCCCFGGENFDTLYVTGARQRLSAAELAAQPLAGSVLALRIGAQGLPESRFAG